MAIPKRYPAAVLAAGLALISTLLLVPSARAAIYTVGDSGVCSHSSLAAAVAAAVTDSSVGPHEIRVVGGVRTINNLNIENPVRDIVIIGGYSNCEFPQPTPGNRTTLQASGATSRVLRIANSNGNERRTVTLRGLTVRNGQSPSGPPGWGGGILVQGRSTLVLDSFTRVQENLAPNGGGIALFNLTTNPLQFTELRVTGDSEICQNQATSGDGGGIYATGGTRVLLDDARLCSNQAARAGGAIALASPLDTLVFGTSGTQLVNIELNRAGSGVFVPDQGFGGAIYSSRGDILYSNDDTPGQRCALLMTSNTANYGGALYVEGSASSSDPFTNVELRNVAIRSNRGIGRGGAIMLRNAVDMRIVKWGEGSCISPSFCVDLWNNSTDNAADMASFGGGGLAFLDHDELASRPALRIAGAIIEGNSDMNGTAAVIDARNQSSVRILRSLLLSNRAGGEGVFRALIDLRANALFAFNTVLQNDVPRLFYGTSGPQVNVVGSIFDAPGQSIGGGNISFIHNNCLLTHTLNGLPAGATLGGSNLGQGFIPRPSSPAIDACASSAGDNFWPAILDGHGLFVPVDVPGVPSVGGLVDMGALEQRDVLFYAGFGQRPTN